MKMEAYSRDDAARYGERLRDTLHLERIGIERVDVVGKSRRAIGFDPFAPVLDSNFRSSPDRLAELGMISGSTNAREGENSAAAQSSPEVRKSSGDRGALSPQVAALQSMASLSKSRARPQ